MYVYARSRPRIEKRPTRGSRSCSIFPLCARNIFYLQINGLIKFVNLLYTTYRQQFTILEIQKRTKHTLYIQYNIYKIKATQEMKHNFSFFFFSEFLEIRNLGKRQLAYFTRTFVSVKYALSFRAEDYGKLNVLDNYENRSKIVHVPF